MAKRRPTERHIFFPWERRGGLLGRIRLDQAGPVIFVLAAVGAVALVGMHERRAAGVRRTRATLLNARAAVDSYMADHDGGCPSQLDGLSKYGGPSSAPRDGWGNALRIQCPGSDQSRYDLSSDGPDGKPGGLDRIE
jgi:type II secretory pathway pseudopilin PulG